jgi:DNA-binding MarR family transcriptional regulator
MTLVYPTEKAEKLLPIIKEATENWESFLFDSLEESEREQFMTTLEKLYRKAASYVENEREGEK